MDPHELANRLTLEDATRHNQKLRSYCNGCGLSFKTIDVPILLGFQEDVETIWHVDCLLALPLAIPDLLRSHAAFLQGQAGRMSVRAGYIYQLLNDH